MNPSVEDRLSSVVRAIGGVILPALPESASLAREQAMLAMGHIQIILAQMPATQAFLVGEAEDVCRMGEAIVAHAAGGPEAKAATGALAAMLATRASVSAIRDAIDAVLCALAVDGLPEAREAVGAVVLEQGAARALKDRQWFAAMGFDSDFSPA